MHSGGVSRSTANAALDACLVPLCSSGSRHHQQPRENLPGGAEEPSLLCSGIRRWAPLARLGGGVGGGCLCLSTAILTTFDFAFSCCQCHHSRGYLFLWNVRLRGERSLVPLLNTGSLMVRMICSIGHALDPQPPRLLNEASTRPLPC